MWLAALSAYFHESIQAAACAGAACVKMAEAAAAATGELTLIATGPMTNVALACLVDPLFPRHVGTLHAMGGAEGKGNVTPYAEWNFHCDPEAAQVVGCTIAIGFLCLHCMLFLRRLPS